MPPILLLLQSIAIWTNPDARQEQTSTHIGPRGIPTSQTFASPYLRQFFLSLPRDLEEVARLDGAGPWLTFRRIPLNTAPLATVAVLTGIGAWNGFFWPFIAAPGEDHQLLPVALQSFKAQSPQAMVDWTGFMAASTAALLPTLVLLLLAGRKVVESVQFSGGK
jgi:multiple sugar transport system permease protein